MANTKELIAQGDLTAALQEVTRELREKPAEMTARVTLFELLCLTGELDRAEKHLDIIEQQRAQKDLGVQVYRNCLKAERERRQVFNEGHEPHFLSVPPSYVDLHLQAISLARQGQHQQARELLDRAEEERPAQPGRLNDSPFKDFRDYDDFVGPVLELIVHDKYTWVPFEHLKRIEVQPPKQLRDMIWSSARLISTSGVEGEVLVPVVYAGTSASSNDAVRLGRLTEWVELNSDLYRAIGLKTFLIDDQDHPIFAAKSVDFDRSAAVQA